MVKVSIKLVLQDSFFQFQFIVILSTCTLRVFGDKFNSLCSNCEKLNLRIIILAKELRCSSYTPLQSSLLPYRE